MTTPCSAFLQPHATRFETRADVAATVALLPGTKVGRWRVYGARRPGFRSDTYGVVLEDGHECAVLTVYNVPALHLGSYSRRILARAQTLTTLEHPGVGGVVDAGLLADGRPYMVTELERGTPLTAAVERWEPQRALTILRAICAPLMFAHDAGVVHGSLTLENVCLLEEDDRFVMLLDWGIERAVFDEAQRAGVASTQRIECVAPEEDIGIVSPKTDAYALGVIAYQLLCGHMPFEADGFETLRAMQRDVRPDPRSLWPEIPDHLEALLVELLAPDPRQRPSVHEAFARLVMPAPVPVAAVEAFEEDVTTAILPLQRRRLPVRITTCFGLAAAAAVAVILVAPPDEASQTIATSARIAPAPRVDPIPVAAPTPSAPVVVVRSVAPAPARVPAPPKATPAPARTEPTPAPRKSVAIAKPPVKLDVDMTDIKNQLLMRYQRVGRAIGKLQQQRGHLAVSDLSQQFRELKIQQALSTAPSRASAAATLADLEKRVERQQSIEIADACLNNPLASGCQ